MSLAMRSISLVGFRGHSGMERAHLIHLHTQIGNLSVFSDLLQRMRVPGPRIWNYMRALRPAREGDRAELEATRYLTRWLVIGVLIGIVAGLGAVLFIRAIGFATDLFLGDLVGYHPPAPLGEGSPARTGMDRPWALPLVIALGGLLSGLIVYTLAPEAEGHGTDAAIEAIHHKGARLRARIPPIKLVASAITIGSGGSGGREGPAAQISSGFASLLAGWLKLSPRDRRIAVAAGMGAGIGAIFRAPLGGAVMAAELLNIHDLEVEALMPGLIASIVGYSIFGLFEGWEPIFGAQPNLGFEHPGTLIYCALLGIICGLIGLLYARSFYGCEALFHKLPIPRMIRPALGGLLVGLLGLKVEGAIHTGYGWVQIGMSPEVLTLPLWLVLILPLAKILATSLSIGSGGSGGIFGPGMVIGGMTGAAFWRLAEGHLPQVPASPAPFVIVGMIAMFGGIAHAPLAMMLMVAEITGNLSLLAPAMIAIALSTALVGDHTIYTSQLPGRVDSPTHRIRMSFPLLSSLSVRDAFRPGPGPAGVPEGPPLAIGMPLDAALDELAEYGVSEAPVLENGRAVGMVTVKDVMTAYRSSLESGLRKSTALPSNTVLIDLVLTHASPLVGHPLASRRLPDGTLVVAIARHGETIVPRGDTILLAGDHISVLTSPDHAAQTRMYLRGSKKD
jgi:CIC family chloride channel protein